MSEQRREGTGPEIALRRALHSLGLRYRLHRAPVIGLRRKADIVFGPARVAVFVDGCFWHGCPEHGRRRHDVNGWYWPGKIARNQRRDEDTDQALSSAGWAVVRVWEHEVISLGGLGALGAAERVKDLLKARMTALAEMPGVGGGLPASAQGEVLAESQLFCAEPVPPAAG